MTQCQWFSDPSDDFYGQCVKDADHREYINDHETRMHENKYEIMWDGDQWPGYIPREIG